jgi:nucleoside-diphosphate-sugar epimerase
MKKVLITGATGFIGRQCVRLLQGRGHHLHLAARFARPMPGPETHPVDLLDPEEVSALVRAVRPTHLLHLAWDVTPGVFWTAPVNRCWVAASLHLFKEFAACGGRRAVLAGSCTEYHWTGDGLCHETRTPLRAATLYGTCKAELWSEVRTLARQEGIGAAWGRIFFLYGPHEHPARLVSSVIRSLLRGQEAPCSEGRQQRDFLHVTDVAGAFCALLESDVEGPVNIGSGDAPPVRSVVERIAAALGRTDLVRFGARPTPAGEPPLVVADTTRLREELRWSPRFNLERGLADTIEWWRTQDGEAIAA